MDLLLIRDYWPGGTNGKLTFRNKVLGVTIEPSASHFGTKVSCVPEGLYLLRQEREGEIRKIILCKIDREGMNAGEFEPELGVKQLHSNIVLVSEITGEGKGVPSKKIWENLLLLIDQALGKGEMATLEIRSCPENALNLTYHQIQWMD